MRKKSTMLAIFALAAFLCGSASLANAKNVPAASGQDIPEVNGTYDVPGHPNLKVRVFVHYPKADRSPAKPGPTCIYNTDTGSEAEVSWAGWFIPASSWTYRVNYASVPSTVNSTNAKTAIANSLAAWQAPLTSKMIFQEGDATSLKQKAMDRNNIIAWGSAPGNALGVTYVWYDSKMGNLIESDTIMNSKFPWSWTAPGFSGCLSTNSYDVQNILTHELGHWVGLDDEYNSAYVNNTMYGYGSKGEIKKDTLTNGDIAGLDAIYPR